MGVSPFLRAVATQAAGACSRVVRLVPRGPHSPCRRRAPRGAQAGAGAGAGRARRGAQPRLSRPQPEASVVPSFLPLPQIEANVCGDENCEVRTVRKCSYFLPLAATVLFLATPLALYSLGDNIKKQRKRGGPLPPRNSRGSVAGRCPKAINDSALPGDG